MQNTAASKIGLLFELRGGQTPSILARVNDAIEVEVLEVDGHAPVPPAAAAPESDPERPWQDWQGRVRQLDMRWWPLWVVLGVLALGLILTLGVVIGAVVLVAKIVGGLIGSVLRLFIGSPSNTSLRR